MTAHDFVTLAPPALGLLTALVKAYTAHIQARAARKWPEAFTASHPAHVMT